eukprot:7956573-Lingulodinium_polyedra.AAC.1
MARAWCVCVVMCTVGAAKSASDRVVAPHSSECRARCGRKRVSPFQRGAICVSARDARTVLWR